MSYANRTLSTLRRLFFALLVLLTRTTTLDTCLRFPRLPAVNVVKMEVFVLGLERISVLWMRAGGNLAASRFREVLVLDMRLLRSFIKKPPYLQGRRKVLVAKTLEAETRLSESIGVNEGVTPIG